MFNPDPKPVKKEKEVMTSVEFRKKYGSKSSLYGKGTKSASNPKKRKKKTIYDTTAWIWCARYIKILHANYNGYVTCKTSGVEFKLGDKRLHAGHCIKVYDTNSTNYATAFDVRNIMPQSSQENRFYGGRAEVMRDKIDEYWGEGTYNELKIKSKQAAFYTKSDLNNLATKFRKMTYDLLEEKGLKKWW